MISGRSRHLISPYTKTVIPMHYGANPLVKGTPAEFLEGMKGSPIKVIVMTEGQTVEF